MNEMSTTQLNRNTHKHDAPYVLIEGPRWGDAGFVGAWLTAAAKVEAIWREAIEDQDFKKEGLDRLSLGYDPNFGIHASSFVARLRLRRTNFVLPLEAEDGQYVDGDAFVMMAEMGFFALAGNHYRMAIPSAPTLASVKAAVLAYAATLDKEYYLHPENLVTTMSFAEASKLQDRLRAIEEFRRDDNHDLLPSA